MSKLTDLQSEDMAVRYGFLEKPAALHLALKNAPEVATLRNALLIQEISTEQVEAFVAELMRCLVPGQRFEEGTALASLAVALEPMQHPFAERFLSGLAAVTAAELRVPARVAAECLEARKAMTVNLSLVVNAAPIAHGRQATSVRTSALPAGVRIGDSCAVA
jgi:hypothetical protein